MERRKEVKQAIGETEKPVPVRTVVMFGAEEVGDDELLQEVKEKVRSWELIQMVLMEEAPLIFALNTPFFCSAPPALASAPPRVAPVLFR